MAKRSGGTRQQGAGVGGITPAPADQNKAWREAEGSEKYTYDRDKVKFQIDRPINDLDGKPIDGITPSMLRYKTEYDFYEVQRNMDDGKYHIASDGYYQYSETMTFNQAVNRALDEAKRMYQNNEGMRDRIFRVTSEDDNAPTAYIWAELRDNNKVRLSITRFKP